MAFEGTRIGMQQICFRTDSLQRFCTFMSSLSRCPHTSAPKPYSYTPSLHCRLQSTLFAYAQHICRVAKNLPQYLPEGRHGLQRLHLLTYVTQRYVGKTTCSAISALASILSMYPTKLSEKERTDNSRIIAISKTLNNKSKTRKLVLAVQTVQTRKKCSRNGSFII